MKIRSWNFGRGRVWNTIDSCWKLYMHVFGSAKGAFARGVCPVFVDFPDG